jgi:micrococcal nuclease
MMNHPMLRHFTLACVLTSTLTGASFAIPTRIQQTRFDYCFTGGGVNCVVDGDTFWVNREKVRIADIDAPETHQPRCPQERTLGNAATRRLHALLNAGPFRLASIDRDTDRYGRKLRIIVRSGQSLGEKLVAEGLAREWDGARRSWCT